MRDLLTELKTLDPVLVPVTVQRESLDQLRDAVLASPRKVPGRLIAPFAAAAAVVIAFAFVWQSGFGHSDFRAVPAASPSPSVTIPINTWVATAPSPLSPRHSSLTVWADGSFFVMGGTSSGVCSAGADCLAPTYLRDGARYDPITDRWSTIANAPKEVIGYPLSSPQVAVLGERIYMLGRTSVLSYNVHSNQWQQLPLPPGDLVLGFGVTGSSLVAVTNASARPGAITFAMLQIDQREWVQHKVPGLRGDTTSAAVVGGQLVLTSLANSPQGSIWVIDTVDPSTGEVRHPDPQGLESFNLAAIELTTSRAHYAVWRGREKKAWFLNMSNSQWSSVALPKTEGAFVGSSSGATTYWPVTVSGMVSVRGHLYNPETQLWSATPGMPTGPDSPIVASGPDLALGCFGYNPTTSAFAKDCYVLRPAEATLARP